MIRTSSLRLWMLAVLGAALLVAMATAIAGRGPWYDEFFTYYVTRPGPGLAALWPVWLRDNHPPLFYFLAWLGNGFGPDFARRRLINLGFALAAAAALALLCRARPRLRPLAAPYVIALASQLPAIDRVDELRSNFLVYATAAVAVAVLAEFARPHERRGPAALALLAGVLALAFTEHLAATMILGAVSAAFGLRLLLARDGRGAAELAGAGAIAALPFLGLMALQAGAIAQNTRSFWIPAGLSGARWAIEGEIIADLAANPPLTLLGGIGLALLAGQSLRQRRLTPAASLALTLAAGLVVAIVVLVAAHLQRPFIIDRYLVSLHPPLAMLLACGVATVLAAAPAAIAVLGDLAMVVAALLAIAGHLERTLARPSWDGTATAIAALARACPATVVHADMSWNAPVRDMPPAENRAVFPYAYGWEAAHHGFALAPEGARTLSATCPTVFWTEHVKGVSVTADGIAARLRGLGYPVAGGRLRRIGDGWILIVPPLVD